MATTSHPTPRISRSPRRKRNLKLIGLRINAGLNRPMLAYRAGVSRETIRLVEDGWTPSPPVQFAIAEIFEMLPLDIWPLDQQKAAR